MMNCCQIATKKHDGGSSEEANQPKRRSVFIEGRSDALSLYSNKAVRMDRLLSSHRRASAPSPTIEIPSDDNDTGNNDIMDTSTTTKTHAITSRRPPTTETRYKTLI